MKKTLMGALGGSKRTRAGAAAAAALMKGGDENMEDEDGSDASAEGEDSSSEDDDEDEGGTTASAVNAETNRIQAIVGSEAGLANPALAQELAFNTDGGRMSAKKANAILGKAGPSTDANSSANAFVASQAPFANGAKRDGGAGASGDNSMNARMAARNQESRNAK